MSAPRIGGLRRRYLPQWPSQRPPEDHEPRSDRAVGQAAPLGAALSSHAAPNGTAVGNCDDRSASRAAQPAQNRPIASQTQVRGGLRHRTIKPLSAEAVRAVQGSTRPVVSKSAASRGSAPASVSINRVLPQSRKVGKQNTGAKKEIAVRTNLPKRVPVLNDEIALIGPALAEFLKSTTAANDNGSQE